MTNKNEYLHNLHQGVKSNMKRLDTPLVVISHPISSGKGKEYKINEITKVCGNDGKSNASNR